MLIELPAYFTLPDPFAKFKLVMPGIVAVQAPKFSNEQQTHDQVSLLNNQLKAKDLSGLPLFILCDDAAFVAQSVNNFIWITFTRSNPSHDIYGINSFTEHKHWGCKGPLIIDARIKPHHAPPLIKDQEIEKKVDRLGVKDAVLHGII